MKTEPKIIQIDLIRRPAYPDRQEISIESIQELANSIESIGLLHPIAVKPLDSGYELISGDRRLTAVMALDWVEIWCTVHYDLSSTDICIMRAQENLLRQNLTPMEEAYAVKRVYTDHQMSINEISHHFLRSREWVTSRLSLCDMATTLQDSVHGGTLPIGHALALSTIPDDATRESMHDLCKAEGATLSVLFGWIKAYKDDNNDTTEIVTFDTKPSNSDSPPKPAAECTICGEMEYLPELVWKPICNTCMHTAKL